MPLPFILAGLAVAAGGYGVKKGYDAKKDFDRAEGLNDTASQIYNDAEEKLSTAHIRAKSAMTRVGEIKFKTYQDLIIPFVDIFSKIKNIEFEKALLNDGNIKFDEKQLRELQNVALEMESIIKGGITALGAGGLAGLAAYGSVGALATASTGAAIGSLSGVAATNATLAWLGGGALSAGGFGMAGGTAVLGGIVAGPVLAIGGAMLASKAEEAVYDARANVKKAELAAEEMQLATVATKAIRTRFAEVHKILEELSDKFRINLDKLFMLTKENIDYATFSEQDKVATYKTFQLATSIKNIIESPILNEDGSLNNDTSNLISTI
ncbi:MAG: hypothetical protein ACTH59_00765 [Pseudoalteromonas nigrifaciens]|uniref:hypothetical protein n=1 Tax=Pseudoalteromonas nigrifaciens TaxID=28109 RepID=UPI003F97FE43